MGRRLGGVRLLPRLLSDELDNLYGPTIPLLGLLLSMSTTHRIQKEADPHFVEIAQLQSKLAAAEARVRELEGWIKTWGRVGHFATCDKTLIRSTYDCSCGYDESIKALHLTPPTTEEGR